MPPKASQKQNFLQGALILSAATALVKVIGALFKIPLSNLIGSEGMGLFTVAYNIYATLFVISTAGLPVAVSKMVSEAGAHRRLKEARAIFRIALLCFVVIGAVGSLFLFFGAPVIAVWMHNPDVEPVVRAIAPAVLFVAVMSAFRGYYQGQGNMLPTAVSQVIEALCKLGIGYVLASMMFNAFLAAPLSESSQARVARMATQIIKDAAEQGKVLTTEAATAAATKSLAGMAAAPWAIVGISIGAVLGAVYLLIRFRRQKISPSASVSPIVRPNGELLGKLLRLAIPVTISSSVLSLTNLIDSSLVMGRLQSAAGYTLETAQSAYGAYTYAQTLFNLPPAFILTVSVSIIPALSVALAKKDHKGAHQTISSSLRVTSLLALPAAAGLIALSFPILNLLYYSSENAAAVTTAAPLLNTLGFAVPFVCLVSLTNAILQSMGLVSLPILTMLAGGACKIGVNYVLVGNPSVNIGGAPMGTLACYAVIAILNLFFIIRFTRSARFLGVFIKPVFASALMGAFAYGVNVLLAGPLGLGARLSVIGAVAASVVFYLLLIFFLKALPKEDLALLPKGEKLAKWLKL